MRNEGKMHVFDQKIKDILIENISRLEEYFHCDVIYYIGDLHDDFKKNFRDFIEHVHNASSNPKNILVFFIKTFGGSAEVTEVIVSLIRQHYSEVYFVIPDYAMSAGTILCMSGNKIYMDYSSSLGPIDPQIYRASQNEWVPAIGYIEKVEKIIKRSSMNLLTQAEIVMLQQIDLAFLSRCEHSCELAKTLIKEWLSNYLLKGNSVLASEIAEKLGDISLWHSHVRYIGIDKLKEIGLPVTDYTKDNKLSLLIRNYSDILTQYVERNKFHSFLNSRTLF